MRLWGNEQTRIIAINRLDKVQIDDGFKSTLDGSDQLEGRLH